MTGVGFQDARPKAGVGPEGASVMKKLIGVIVVIIVFILMVFAYMEMGKRTAQEGKAVIDTSRGALDRARQSAEEMNK